MVKRQFFLRLLGCRDKSTPLVPNRIAAQRTKMKRVNDATRLIVDGGWGNNSKKNDDPRRAGTTGKLVASLDGPRSTPHKRVVAT